MQSSVESLQTNLIASEDALNDHDLHFRLGFQLIQDAHSPLAIRSGVYHLLRGVEILERLGNHTYAKAQLAKYCVNAGMQIRRARNHIPIPTEQVIRLAKMALEADPENRYGWSLLAQEYAERMEYKLGLESGKRALEIQEDSYTHNAIGKCYEGLGDIDRAAFHYMRRARLQGSVEGYYTVAEYLTRMHRYQNAREMVYEILQLSPHDENAKRRLRDLDEKIEGSPETLSLCVHCLRPTEEDKCPTCGRGTKKITRESLSQWADLKEEA